MTTATHTLAAGTSVADRYADLGMPVGNTTLPLSLMSCALIGPPNSGKSFLIQSCDDGLIFNLDMSTSVYPNSKAMAVPIPGPDGRPVGPGGAVVTLDWDFLLRIKALLLKKAAENKPRPKTVFIDSLSSLVRILVPWVIGQFSTAEKPKNYWGEIDGRAGWQLLYDQVVNLIADLRRAGYGVCLLVHLERTRTPIGLEASKAPEWEVAAGPGLWQRLYSMLDMVIPTMQEMRTESVKIEQPPLVMGGKEIPRPPRVETRSVRKFKATFAVPELAGIHKPRSLRPLGEIDLPEIAPWASLEAAIAEANKPVSPAG